MTLQINFKGLAYIYFFIITSFIISLFYFYPADKNEPYIYTEYDYILLESYSPQYLSYLNHFDNNWQTTNIDTILYNPDDKQYAVIRLKIPEHINAGNNLYIKTFKNNFDIYADTKYIKSNVPIEVESNYIRTPNVNIYTLNKIENLDYIYIYMQTNMPYYAGYITDLNIIEDENLSGVYKPYYVNFLMFVICFIYSTVFTIYVFITNSRTHNIDLRRISLTMLFFTLFLLTDSSAMFSYFTLIHWTAFNVIWISLIMGYYINTISILSNNTISTFLLKCISYCFSIPIVYTMFLDYNYIASYSVTFKYVLVFIIIALILASILMAISKPLASAQKITLCINLLFIVIFSIKFIEDTQLLNIHFSSIYSLIVLVFVIFSYSLLRNYMNKNKEKLKLMDLVLEKRFEINTIIDCVNDTISTDYDVVSLCEKLHKSVNKLALDKENISMYMYSLNNRRNTFKNLYKTDSMTYYRLEVEHFIENALKYPNGIYLVSNREELHFCVEHGDSSVLVILKCIPYFDDDDYEKLHLYLSSIKKTLENILIYSSSMGNQESVLEEISKIINEREKNKYNSVATGELIYYIARKSGMNYTNTMQCKIVSYAINIGKLNIRSELLNKRVLNNQEQEEYNEYINITHDMVKNYSNSIMQLVKTVCEQYNYDYRLISSNLFDDSSIDINVKIIKVAESMSYFYLNKFIYSYGKYDSALQLVQVQSGITLDPSIIKILHDNKKEVKAILDNYL